MTRREKREDGTGAVEQLPSGRWRIRATIGGKRKTLGGPYETQDEAVKMLAGINAGRRRGMIEAPSEVTLASFGETWLNGREINGSKERVEVKSIDGERSVWGRHVAPSALAKMPIETIEQTDVEDYAVSLRDRRAVRAITSGPDTAPIVTLIETDRQLSRSQQTHALRLIRQCLAEAVRQKLITTNPAVGVGVALGGPRPRDLSDDWLRWPEVETLLTCKKIPERDRVLFVCAIGLALRLNDLKALEVSQVVLDDAVAGPHVQVWIAKSEKHHRVPVMPWLVPVLRAHLATLPKNSRWVFPTRDGERYGKFHDFGWSGKYERRQTVEGYPYEVLTRSALELAGVHRKIRFHDLRGTCATHLALGTWGRTWHLTEIQHLLAHSDQRVTERYVRRAKDPLAAAAAATPGKSTVVHEGVGADLGIHLVLRDAPTASRTRDLSLRKPEETGASVEVSSCRGLRVDNEATASHAAALLAAVGAGSLTRETMLALADAALDDDVTRLALEVREGGEHAVRRAIELAALVLARGAARSAAAR